MNASINNESKYCSFLLLPGMSNSKLVKLVHFHIVCTNNYFSKLTQQILGSYDCTQTNIKEIWAVSISFKLTLLPTSIFKCQVSINHFFLSVTVSPAWPPALDVIYHLAQVRSLIILTTYPVCLQNNAQIQTVGMVAHVTQKYTFCSIKLSIALYQPVLRTVTLTCVFWDCNCTVSVGV